MMNTEKLREVIGKFKTTWPPLPSNNSVTQWQIWAAIVDEIERCNLTELEVAVEKIERQARSGEDAKVISPANEALAARIKRGVSMLPKGFFSPEQLTWLEAVILGECGESK